MRTASIRGGGDKLDMEQREVRYLLGPTRHCWIPITVSDCKGGLLPFPSSLLHIYLPNFGQVPFLANPTLESYRKQVSGKHSSQLNQGDTAQLNNFPTVQ